MAKNYNGTYNTWTGVLIHIAGMSRPDDVHSIMGLCGYNTRPTMATYKTLNHLIQYLYHYPYIPIMYSREHMKSKNIEDVKLQGHVTCSSWTCKHL